MINDNDEQRFGRVLRMAKRIIAVAALVAAAFVTCVAIVGGLWEASYAGSWFAGVFSGPVIVGAIVDFLVVRAALRIFRDTSKVTR